MMSARLTKIGLFLLALSMPCFSAANQTSGVYAIWTDEDNYDLDWVKGGQVFVHWRFIQNGHNDFDFSNLDKKLEEMYKHGIKTTIQIEGNAKPDFLFDKVPYYPKALSHQVKDSKGTLMYWHPYHIDQFKNLLIACANHLKNSKYKDIIMGIRLNYNRVGSEHSLSSSTAPALSEWVIPKGVTYTPWLNSSEHRTYKTVIEEVYFEHFGPLMTVLVREDDWYNDRIVSALKSGIAGVYQTGSEMEPRYRSDEEVRYGPFLKYCRTGIAKICYAEPWAASDGTRGGGTDPRWSSYAQHNYWRSLVDLHVGVSAVSYYGEDLERRNDPEYMQTFNFVNKYAGFHAKPYASPGAWIAFREGDFLKGDYTFLMSRTSGDGNFVGLDTRYDGKWALGEECSRYSAWARKLLKGNTVTVELDKDFNNSLSGKKKVINVTYLDRGNGSMSISAFGRNSQLDIGNSSSWKTVTFTTEADNNSANISITANGADLVLHMIEVTRGQTTASTTNARPNPPGSIEIQLY